MTRPVRVATWLTVCETALVIQARVRPDAKAIQAGNRPTWTCRITVPVLVLSTLTRRLWLPPAGTQACVRGGPLGGNVAPGSGRSPRPRGVLTPRGGWRTKPPPPAGARGGLGAT